MNEGIESVCGEYPYPYLIIAPAGVVVVVFSDEE